MSVTTVCVCISVFLIRPRRNIRSIILLGSLTRNRYCCYSAKTPYKSINKYFFSHRYGLANDECASFISTLNLRESEYGGECAALERFTCRTHKMSSRYRTFDGSCNNPVRSSWGQALTGYKRLLHPRYADGIEEVGVMIFLLINLSIESACTCTCKWHCPSSNRANTVG